MAPSLGETAGAAAPPPHCIVCDSWQALHVTSLGTWFGWSAGLRVSCRLNLFRSAATFDPGLMTVASPPAAAGAGVPPWQAVHVSVTVCWVSRNDLLGALCGVWQLAHRSCAC